MGCTRGCTPEDFRQICNSIPKNTKEKIKERREKIQDALHRSTSGTLINILSDPGHRAYKSVSALLEKSVGSKMTDKERGKLPEAFRTILKHHPSAMGVFKAPAKERGPSASAVQHHYEIFSVAALKEKPYKTKLGKELDIANTDRLDLGIKLAKNYAQPKKHGTIEADMLINRPVSPIEEKTIAMDAKYSKEGKYGPKKETARQIEGIRTGLRDGKIDEFYYVTNGVFTPGFHNLVQTTNIEIARDFVENNRKIYSTLKEDWLHSNEKGQIVTEELSKSFFTEENIDQINELVSKYDIPQIDLCEYVTFRNT